jgi:hypothetical protein
MEPFPSVRTVGRTVVIATWLLVLAVAGRPVGGAVLLGVALVLVWASPYLLATNRRSSARWPAARPRPLAEPGEAGRRR